MKRVTMILASLAMLCLVLSGCEPVVITGGDNAIGSTGTGGSTGGDGSTGTGGNAGGGGSTGTGGNNDNGSTGTDPGPGPDTGPQSWAALTFDDGVYDSDMQQAFDYMSTYKIPWTMYIVTDYVGDGDGHVTWPVLKNYADKGVEVGNHTKSHKHPLEMSTADFRNEVNLADVALRQHGIQASAFAIPFGEGYNLVGGQVVLDNSLLNVLLGLGYIETSRQAFTGDNPDSLNAVDSFNPMAVKSFGWKQSTPESVLTVLVDQARIEKKGLALGIHSIAAIPNPKDDDQINLEVFKRICNYIRMSGVRLVTISQGAAEMAKYKK